MTAFNKRVKHPLSSTMFTSLQHVSGLTGHTCNTSPIGASLSEPFMNCSYIVVEISACLSDPKSCVWERDSQGNGAKGQGWCDLWSPIKTIKIYHNRYQAQVEPALYLCLVSHKAHHLEGLMGPVVCGSGGVRGGSRGCLISIHHNCLAVTITENFWYHKVTKDTSSFPFHASKSAHLLKNLYFFSSINTLESFLIVILFILHLFLFTLTQKNRKRLCDDDCKSSAV